MMPDNDQLTMHRETRIWYQTGQGKYIKKYINQYVRKSINDVFGFYALQLGVKTGDFLHSCRIKSCYSLSFELNGKQQSIQAEYDFLPIMGDNVDLIVANHVLEASTRPHQVLREIDRILLPEGHCILIGFNSFRYWRWSHLARKIVGNTKKQNFYSPTEVNEWLSVLGFEIVKFETIGMGTHWMNKRLFQYLEKWEALGRYLTPYLGSVYIIHAKKQHFFSLLKKNKWSPNLVLTPSLVNTAATTNAVKKTGNKH